MSEVIGISPALEGAEIESHLTPQRKWRGYPLVNLPVHPGANRKIRPPASLKAHAKSEVPSTRTIASLRDVDAAIDDRGAEVDAAADALLEVACGQRDA